MYQRRLPEICAEYGFKSRAHYAMLYEALARTFVAEIRSRDYADRSATSSIHLLRNALQDLTSELFELMADRPGPRHFERDMSGQYPIYRYNNERYSRTMAHYATELVGARRIVLTTRTIAQLGVSGFYLYCISEHGEVVLYGRPLAYREIISGVWEGNRRVAHPMLVEDRNLAVRAAGEVCIVKNKSGGIGGALFSRASGHFLPGPETVPGILRAAQEVLGLSDWRRVGIIGDGSSGGH
jgi:hypothetical protein